MTISKDAESARKELELSKPMALVIEDWIEEQQIEDSDLRAIALKAATGEIPDSQLASFMMAARFVRLGEKRAAVLTKAMADSGNTSAWNINKPLVDKHSTGGCGDKTSFIVAPLLAANGAAVPMVSGRGLGMTGGTLDKLESIDGFNVSLDKRQKEQLLNTAGMFIVGADKDMAPADRVLYAIRDACGSVKVPELICASILSKKIAEGCQHLLLDVKCGKGAFMAEEADALELAGMLVRCGNAAGLKTLAYVTDMNHVLGTSAGNAVEIHESLQILRGNWENRASELLKDLCLDMTRELLASCGIDRTLADLETQLTDGTALKHFETMVEQQGGTLTKTSQHHGLCVLVRSKRSGTGIPAAAEAVAKTAWLAGAGRGAPGDPIDVHSGVVTLYQEGDPIRKGEPLFKICGRNQQKVDQARDYLQAAVASGVGVGETYTERTSLKKAVVDN